MKPTRGGEAYRVYRLLYKAYGPQRWWPAETDYEVCVGAILTQSTSWRNVEKAVLNMKAAGILGNDAILEAKSAGIARLIRPSLYYNVKARKLKEFAGFLGREYGGKVGNMRRERTATLRAKLLSVWGLGPETVDSMLLYALGRPSFVVDAYTRRIFRRLGLTGEDARYDVLKAYFENHLPRKAGLYNEYHALIVEHGKSVCRTKPKCGVCCLRRMCGFNLKVPDG